MWPQLYPAGTASPDKCPPEGSPQIWGLYSCVVIWPVGGGPAKDGQYTASYQDPPELGLFVQDPWRVPPPPRWVRGSQHTDPLCPAATLCPQPSLDLEISHTRNWGGRLVAAGGRC